MGCNEPVFRCKNYPHSFWLLNGKLPSTAKARSINQKPTNYDADRFWITDFVELCCRSGVRFEVCESSTMQGFGGVMNKFDNLKLTSDKKQKNKSSSVTYSKYDFMRIRTNVTVKKTWKPMLELCNKHFIDKLLGDEDEELRYESFREAAYRANQRIMQSVPQRHVVYQQHRVPPVNQMQTAFNRHPCPTMVNRGSYFHHPQSPGMGSGYGSRWGNSQSFTGDNFLTYGEQRDRQTFTGGYGNHGAQYHLEETSACGDRKRFGGQFDDSQPSSGEYYDERADDANRLTPNSEMRQLANRLPYGRDMNYQRRGYGRPYRGFCRPPFMQRGCRYYDFSLPEEERKLYNALLPFDYNAVADVVLGENYVDIHPKLMDLIRNYGAIRGDRPSETVEARKTEDNRVEIEAKLEKQIVQCSAEIVFKDVQVFESGSGSFKQAKSKAKKASSNTKKKNKVNSGDQIYLRMANLPRMNGYYSPRQLLALMKLGVIEMTSELKLQGSSEFQTLRDVIRVHGTVPGFEKELDLLSSSSSDGRESIISEYFSSLKLISMHFSDATSTASDCFLLDRHLRHYRLVASIGCDEDWKTNLAMRRTVTDDCWALDSSCRVLWDTVVVPVG
ncbi:hypothetical protein T07_14020 [Trichinella nelsoni]|uniref:Uncharacterized protein n=1 Tax=Trichinella nelsoni TaxID=6336 RepID=A0A0V0S375_9BILA|nr:hypothetical protein T07_14020 [Trichinella nelsoni]